MITETMVAAAGRVAAKREHASPLFDLEAYKADYFERHLAKAKTLGLSLDRYDLARLEVIFDREYYKQIRKLRGYP